MYLNKVTSQKDIMRQCELMSATTRPGITGLGPVNTLSLHSVLYITCSKKWTGANLFCLLCKCTVNMDIFIKKQTPSLNCNKENQSEEKTSDGKPLGPNFILGLSVCLCLTLSAIHTWLCIKILGGGGALYSDMFAIPAFTVYILLSFTDFTNSKMSY